MTVNASDPPPPGRRKARRGEAGDLLPQDLATADLDPAMSAAEEDEEARLPDLAEDRGDEVAEGLLAQGHAAIENAVRLAPTSPGVYRMLNAANDVLYVGKAKNVKKRLSSYARSSAPHPARILRMIAATAAVEIVSTTTETEALLLEILKVERESLIRLRNEAAISDDVARVIQRDLDLLESHVHTGSAPSILAQHL